MNVGWRELAFIVEGDSDYGPDIALCIQDRQRDGGLSIDGLCSRLHRAGAVFLQVTRLNGLFALQREAGHAFAVRDPLDRLADGGRDVDRSGKFQTAVFEQVNGSGSAGMFVDEFSKPLLKRFCHV